MKLEDKYIVLKRSDVEEALQEYQKANLGLICFDIEEWREQQGKKINRYIVINHDEPYFQQVLKLMGIE